MGSIISLSLGALELDWGKNSFFRNHSSLFMPDDVRPAPYYYAEGIIEDKPAFVRSLRSIIRRLELLGYTLLDCERLYEEAIAATPSNYSAPALTFERFARAMRNINVRAVKIPGDQGDHDLGEYIAREIFTDPEFTKLENQLGLLPREDGPFFTFFENVDPYVLLRLLAENPQNIDLEVVWRFADVLDGGWIDEDELYEGVPQKDRCLVVTEGSSDGAILREALLIAGFDVADFFEFVDMSENYPFTGTGNLFRFCQGLARIKIQNRILIVLDNDTAGHTASRRITALDLPPRMRVAVLPDLEECRRVRTLGPSGTHYEDINGRAVSIEWFLDTSIPGHPEPTVRWTTYNDALNAYQGELIDKETYTRHFFATVKRGAKHDWPKLARLWEHLLATCTGPGG
jgi:HEPN/Toprim N-terminal domain 1